MKKTIAGIFLGVLLALGGAWAGDEPDLQGRIVRMDTIKNVVIVLNELENKIGKREYRVKVKQGMIGDYKKNDKLKVWLMADRREASMIERIDR